MKLLDLNVLRELSDEESVVCTGGALQWIASTSSQKVPVGAVPGGYEFFQGRTYQNYICRANQGSDLVPGKLASGDRYCYIPYFGKELGKNNYDVLIHT